MIKTKKEKGIISGRLLRETGVGGFLRFGGVCPDRGRASYLRRLLNPIRNILLLFTAVTVLLVAAPLHAADIEDISLNTTCGDEEWNLKYGIFVRFIDPRLDIDSKILLSEMEGINDDYDVIANNVEIATGILSLVGMFGVENGLELAAAGLGSAGLGLVGIEAEYGLDNIWLQITGEMIDMSSAMLSALSDPSGLSVAVYFASKTYMIREGISTIFDLNETRYKLTSLTSSRSALFQYYRSCGDYQAVSESLSAPYPISGCTYDGATDQQLYCAAINSSHYEEGSDRDSYLQIVADIITGTRIKVGEYKRTIENLIPPEPIINSVSVSPDLGCQGYANKQWVTINGQSFLDTSKVVLETGAVPYEISAGRTVFIDATQIDVCAGVTYASNWTAQVVNALNSSNTYSFSVSGTTPSVSINASPSSISSGASTSLSWSSANVSSCSAAGGWGGAQSISGSISVSPSTTTTYTLNCTGPGGNASDSVTVTVGSSQQAPKVSLVASPLIINPGDSSNLAWGVTDATSCSASGGNWNGAKSASGSFEVIYPSTTTTYTLTCTGAGGSASDSVTVIVGTSTPVVNLTVSASSITQGGSSTLKWSSTAMNSCTATGGWSGSKSLIGVQSVQPSLNTTYTLTCTGSGSGTETELVRNGGFDGTASEWTKVGSFYAGEGFYNYRTRYGYAYLSNSNGTGGNNLQGELYQNITIPSGITTATLSFWVAISTEETVITPYEYDALSVWIQNTSGSYIELIALRGNNDAEAGAYRQIIYDVTKYSGQTIRLNFSAATNGSYPTVFRIDDVSVIATTVSSSYSDSDSVTVSVTRPAAPTVSFSASPDSITAGQSSTLRWSTSNATGCTASGGWSGSKSTSGGMAVYPAQSTTYSITCTGSGDSVTGNATVMVIPPAPTLSMSANPSNIVAGEASRLSWNTTNVTRCTAYSAWGDEGTKPISGSQLVYPSSTMSYVLSCEGTAGSVVRDVTVLVVPHTLTITNWPSGSPNPVDSENIANLSATATDSLQSHSMSYSWSSQCIALGSNGSFSNSNAQNTSWTAPQNTTGTQQDCSISVRASDGSGGLEQIAVYIQKVGAVAQPNSVPITVTLISGLTTTEAGGTATFAVVLNSQSTANVTIGLSSTDTAEGTVAPPLLTFTSSNWNTPQTVTVTGVDDAVTDGDQNYTIITAAATSSDTTYNGFNPADVSVTNLDNEGVVDTDGDGLPDSWEIQYFGDDISAYATIDTDNDGLTNLQEYQYGTDPNNTDTDGDGDSDGDEVLYGANPTDTLDTLDSHRPNTPVILPVAGDAALRDQIFDVEGFGDPDQAQGDYLSASEWEISTDQSFTDGSSIYYKTLEKNTDDNEVDYRQLMMPDIILVKATDYWVRTRHQDSVGLWSVWSVPLAFSTVAIDPDDLDDNDIDDSYQVTGYADTDGNSIDDSTEGIRTLYDAEGGATIGIRAGSGTLGSLIAISGSDIPTGQMPADLMSYGLFSFRVDGLLVDTLNPAMVDVTFYFPEPLPSGTKWYKYDSVSGTMTDFTANVVFSGNRAIVTLTDAGTGDADNVINGVIVDPSGPALPQPPVSSPDDNGNDNSTSTSSSGGGGGGSLNPLLLLMMICSLFYFVRQRYKK